jgi:hypothetical protein
MANDFNMGLGGASVNPFLGQQNPYLQNIIDLTSRGLVDNYGRTAVPAQNAAMVRSGSFGNSGLQEMQRADQEQLQRSLTDSESKLRFNDYTQQQAMYGNQQNENFRQAQLAQQGQQFGSTLGENQRQFDQNFGRSTFNDAFTQNQTNLQAALGLLGWEGGMNQGDIANTTQQQNAPLGYLQAISQVGSGIGGMGGTATSNVGTTSSPAMSALGGAQLANSWWNTQGGGSTPISASNQNAFDAWGAQQGGGGGWWGTAG